MNNCNLPYLEEILCFNDWWWFALDVYVFLQSVQAQKDKNCTYVLLFNNSCLLHFENVFVSKNVIDLLVMFTFHANYYLFSSFLITTFVIHNYIQIGALTLAIDRFSHL